VRKLLVAVLLLVAVTLPDGCGFEGDPMLDDMWTLNIYPGAPHTYTVGSENNTYAEGWFDEVNTGNLTVSENTTFGGGIRLEGDGEVWIELRVKLDWSTVQAHGKPDHVTRGIFDGYSLPVYAADNEELFFEICVPDRWKGPAWTKLGDVGDKPGGMAVYGDVLYIPMEGVDTVWGYDGVDFGVPAAVGDAPVYATTHGGSLYVSCYGDDTIWEFDGTTWSKSGDVGNGPYGMVSDGTDLYVACLAAGADEIWRLSSGVWAVDSALGLGGVAGAVGTDPLFMAYYGGDVYVGCGGVDDDVWIRTGGAWAKDDDVDGNPQEFQEHLGSLYLNCYSDDTVWVRSGGAWAVATNIQTDQGNAPIGLTEYGDSLFSACMDSVWSDHHTLDAFVVPFWNENSDFTIVTADEPMYLTEYGGRLYCACNDGDSIWVYEGQTAKLVLHVWIAAAQVNAADAFRVQVEHECFTSDVDVVPTTTREIHREIQTGVADQYQSYGLHIPIDMTGCLADNSMGIRLVRVDSSDEIAGELVIQHVGVVFKCDKIGSGEP